MSQLIGFPTPPSEASASDPSDSGALIKDTNEASFMEDVIEASQSHPVIVDFTAPWCGPCKTLIPMLEKHVNAAGGSVSMVKVNIDENQMLASQLRIQSVPTVYAFFQGQPVDGFQGSVPESQIKEFVSKLAAMGGDGVDEEAVETALAEAKALLEQDKADEALAGFQEVLHLAPNNAEAYAGLALSVFKLEGPEAAQELIDSLEPEMAETQELVSAVASIKLAVEGAALAGELAPLKQRLAQNPSDHDAALELAQALAAGGEKDAACQTLLESIKIDREWNEAAARTKLLELFEAFGPTDPATVQARKRLSSVLFS